MLPIGLVIRGPLEEVEVRVRENCNVVLLTLNPDEGIMSQGGF